MDGNVKGVLDNPVNLPTFTSVGNGWILCRSKSHGRIYYFNTVTGEAVWNLSNEEIEKAKKRTGKLPIQLENPSINYPEPREPPGDQSNHEHQNNLLPFQASQYATPKVYNKQIINNQFTRPSFTPFMAPCQNCNPIPSIVGVNSEQPYNPVWVQPPPIFLSSPSTSMGNKNQSPENICHHQSFLQGFTVQNTSVPLSRRFEFSNQKRNLYPNRPHGINKFNKNMNNRFNTWKQPFVPRRMPNMDQKDIGDLRTKLSARKPPQSGVPNATQETNLNKVEEACSANKFAQELQASTSFESSHVEDELCSDDGWLKIHGVVDGDKLKLDVEILKKLATKNSECEYWYIVIDKNVLMKHFNLLNVLISSDNQCRLMIVRDLMTEVQAAARADRTKDGPRKVLRGLSHLFAAKLAVIAEYTFKSSEIKDSIGILNFCTMLQQQNEHVIFLSNEEQIQEHSSEVPKLTIRELKELLIKDTTKLIKIACPIMQRNIKITFPNEMAENEVYDLVDDIEGTDNDMDPSGLNEEITAHDEQVMMNGKDATAKNKETSVIDLTNTENLVTYMETATQSRNILEPEHISKPFPTNKKETNVQTDNCIPAVKMVDAEVQTDPSPELLRQKDSVGVNTVEDNNKDSNTNSSPHDINSNFDKNTMSNKEMQEIRLKRSMSHQTITGNNDYSEKRHFKWHRKKRDVSHAFSDSASSLDDRMSRVTTNTALENNGNSPYLSHLQDAICQLRSQSTQMFYDDPVEGSETSSCVLMCKTPNENILIEETSTSDVISNSMSYVGSENYDVVKKSNEKNIEAVQVTQSKNVMFEITSKAMELNLKMRCDEWLAQFIQIMEEALARVLERESQEIVKTMPPPWTLHEATECVKRTFFNDFDVCDAATKLSQVIYRMSDARGKIIVNFKPNEFMELYSYGVYLVDALQNILEKFEDLQIAAESLTKLLSDIENPIADSGSVGDTVEVSVVISESSNEETYSRAQSVVSKKSSNSPKSPKVPRSDSNSSPGKYNLRSAYKKKLSEDTNEETPIVKFIRKVNIPDDFFTSLHLQRKDGAVNSAIKISQDNAAKSTNTDNKNTATNSSPNKEKGPNIIRNFKRCLEFEEKLKKNSRQPLDMDMLDYSVGYDDEYENMEEDYLDKYVQEGEYISEKQNTDSPNDFMDFADKSQVDDNNNSFKVLVGSLVKEIKETIVKVHTFCKKTQDELQSKNMLNGRRLEVYNKAQIANVHITNVCNDLRRLKESANENIDGFQSRLKEAGILLNEKEGLLYRDVISSCIEHGDTLLEALNHIMDAVAI